MKFIKPKRKRKVDWEVSEDTKVLVKYYAQYTELSEEEVVDVFLGNLRYDKDFIAWAERKRNNKRIMELLSDGAPGDVQVG